MQSIQVVDTSFVAQRQFLMVQTVRVHGYRRPCCAGPAGSLPRRGAELLNTVAVVPVVVSQVLQFSRADVERQPSSHCCSLLNSGLVVACPLCAGWFGVQKTALVPQLQCSDMVSGDFLGPCTQVQGRGPCPQGHSPHN